MTPTEHEQRIREIAFKLEKAENGMGMPYSREDVAHYRNLLEVARKDAELDAELDALTSDRGE